MQFSKMFFVNISLLITIMYLINASFKYLLSRMSNRFKYGASIALFVFSGWLCMLFGLRLSENVIFDLRFVPLIAGVIFFRKPAALFIIGAGIGLTRFTFGLNEASLAGFINMVLLGALSFCLVAWFERNELSRLRKAAVSILAINIGNSLNIALFGVIPFYTYVTTILPIAFPVSLALCAFFMFILSDFYSELERSQELKLANELLRRQTEELRAAKFSLEEKAEQLTKASIYKSEFLANMSHELKTPLNGIILLSQLIGDQEDGRLTEEDLQYLKIIHSSGEELLRQINDMLDLSKVETGRMDIQLEDISLYEIPQILQHQFQWEAEQKGLVFEIRMAPDLPELLRTDGMRVNQILKNLLSNAFKFTDVGKVVLEVYRTHSAPPGNQIGNWIAMAVSDSGIGIAEEKHRLIFEAFTQADGSISRRYGGTGLGLSISLELAKLLGGHLMLMSREGEGSTFTLYLPITAETEAAAGVASGVE